MKSFSPSPFPSPYLDLGFDLTSEPDASLPLLLEAKNEGFSFPRDGLGTRFLPVNEVDKDVTQLNSTRREAFAHLYSLHSRKPTIFA